MHSYFRAIIAAILCLLLAHCASWNPFAFENNPNSDEPDYHYPWDGSTESSDKQTETSQDSTTTTETSDNSEIKKPDPSTDSRLQIEQKEKTSRGRDIVTRFYGAELVR
ncbi:MAG: hypothetical protein KDK37_19565, partial [Leptospiraceae bacterium]|nr:hypothetical protein [Leptospiraceae bacterium]